MYPILEAATTTPTNTFLNSLLAAIPTSIFSALVTYFMFRKQNIKVDKEKAYTLVIKDIFKPFHTSLEKKLYHKVVVKSEIKQIRKSLNILIEKRKTGTPKSKLKYSSEIYKVQKKLDRTISYRNLYKVLTDLDKKIKQKNLEFYLNDRFLFHLEDILKTYKKINYNNPTKFDLTLINDRFIYFSAEYLSELQRARKAIGLKKRSDWYREILGLYSNRFFFFIRRHKFLVLIFVFYILIFVVAFVLIIEARSRI